MRVARTAALLAVTVCHGILLAAPALAMPPAPSLERLLDLCASATVAEAAAKGDALGWGRSSAERLADWRAGFVAHNGGSVEVVGWRRSEREADSLLAFWIARGPSGHRACTYSAAEPEGLLAALTRRFGEPASLDRQSYGTTASWTAEGTDIAFSAVGSSALVNISRRN